MWTTQERCPHAHSDNNRRKQLIKIDQTNNHPLDCAMKQFAFVVVGTMLIAAPELGNSAQRSDRIDALLQIAAGVGHVIGAASVCREISWPRIKSLTDKFSDLIKVSVTQGEVFSSIQQAYDQSAIEGQRTVSSKNTDCAAAVRKHAG